MLPSSSSESESNDGPTRPRTPHRLSDDDYSGGSSQERAVPRRLSDKSQKPLSHPKRKRPM